MNSEDVSALYVAQANKLKDQGRYKEAERWEHCKINRNNFKILVKYFFLNKWKIASRRAIYILIVLFLKFPKVMLYLKSNILFLKIYLP